MESLTALHEHLKGLRSQAKRLSETCVVLNAIFDAERTQLGREDQTSRLLAVHRRTIEQVERLKALEASASRGYSEATLISSSVAVAVGCLVRMVSRDARQSAIADYLLQSPKQNQQPFGLVMVSIGPRGLPGDVEVISISQLARESKWPQPAIINRLQGDGYLLFSEEVFTLLVNKLLDDIREGRLRLPLSSEDLSQVTASIKLVIRPTRTVFPPRPQT
jgi:hypothetical protein